MKVYTKKGDSGTTALIGRTTDKADPTVEALGDLDELNAWIGMVAASCPAQMVPTLHTIQGVLLELGAEIASAAHHAPIVWQDPTAATLHLEASIDEMQATLPNLSSFILPGGKDLAAKLHVARAVCRRTERSCVRIAKSTGVRVEILAFLNRLSDWLFVFARWSADQCGDGDILWSKPS